VITVTDSVDTQRYADSIESLKSCKSSAARASEASAPYTRGALRRIEARIGELLGPARKHLAENGTFGRTSRSLVASISSTRGGSCITPAPFGRPWRTQWGWSRRLESWPLRSTTIRAGSRAPPCR